MKILFVSNLYPPNAIGGYEQLCFDVAQAFSLRGHQVSVLTSNYGGQCEEYLGQRISRSLKLLAPSDNIYGELELSTEERHRIEKYNAEQLAGVVNALNPDVIFVWNLYFLPQSFVDVVTSFKLPVVFFLTDNWLAAFLKPDYVARYFRDHVFSRPSLLRNLWGRMKRARREYPVDAHAIFSSKFMEGYYGGAGLDFQSTSIIYNGVNFVSRPEVNQADRNLGSEVRLLFAGRVVEIKGVETAIRALPSMVDDLANADIKLSIVGDQREKPFCDRIKRLILELELAERVTFLPPVEEDQLPALFADHDIYLFPSLYEPFSLTLLHAMYAGIPIVASKAGGNPEAIEHRVNGMLHQTGDHRSLASSVVELLRNPILAAKVANNAKIRAENFQFSYMVDELDRYFEALVSQR